MQPYQERVVAEQEALESKIDLLAKFLGSGDLTSIAYDEIQRLTMQLRAMQLYAAILSQRIANF